MSHGRCSGKNEVIAPTTPGEPSQGGSSGRSRRAFARGEKKGGHGIGGARSEGRGRSDRVHRGRFPLRRGRPGGRRMKRGDLVTVAVSGDHGKPRPAVVILT